VLLRTNLGGDPTLRQVLRQVRDTTLAAYAHQDLPFEDLVRTLEHERALKRSSLCQVLFVLQHAAPPPRKLPGLTLRVLAADQSVAEPGATATTFDCILMMRETPQGLTGSCIYKTALFEAATIKRLLRDFQEVLARLVAQPEQQLSRLEHRSSIAPSPLAGEDWDGGAEAGTDAVSHAWPHPHPCPPPSRGRESARTGSPIDYLTDVLGVLAELHCPP
jgi:non-ribosomal peptide synthetase component F